MKEDRIRWNMKYDAGKEMGSPSPLVVSHHGLSPGALVLDVAAGAGRNALFLAKQGYRVVAMDLSDQALDRLLDLGHPNIFPVQADLDTFPVQSERFDMLICCYFLDRRLMPLFIECLKPGGILLFESVMGSDLPVHSHIGTRDYLLRRNELLHVFLSMRVLLYEEKLVQEREHPEQKRVLARLAAQKGWTGDSPLARLYDQKK